MQTHTEDNRSNEEVYSIRSDILIKNCRKAMVLKVQISKSVGLPEIMFLQEEANSIENDTIFDSSIGTAARILRVSARWSADSSDWEHWQILSISIRIESRKAGCWITSTTENFLWYDLLQITNRESKNWKSSKRLLQHMHWCSFVKMKDIYLHFSWLLDCLFTRGQDHGFWWMYCTRLGSQFHTWRYSS